MNGKTFVSSLGFRAVLLLVSSDIACISDGFVGGKVGCTNPRPLPVGLALLVSLCSRKHCCRRRACVG